jgi:hypothetical protein
VGVILQRCSKVCIILEFVGKGLAIIGHVTLPHFERQKAWRRCWC